MQILIFLAAVYGLLGIWQLRNYACCGERAFSSVIAHNFGNFGLLKVESSKGWLSHGGIQSLINHDLYAFVRGFFALLFHPISFKYFAWMPFRIIGVILSYPWTVLCGVGLVAGALKIKKNLSYQFLLLGIIYFCSVSVLNAYTMVEARMRMSVLPCTAILSVYGWSLLWEFAKKRNFFRKA
jgi:hypothetical protein